MIVGAHANAGSPGVISHNFAFDSFTVNGKPLNEAGIAAFIGGEMGVPFVLAAGDDVLTAETKEMLGPIETVTVKTAVSGSAAITISPARAHQQLRAAAERAVRRAKAGALKPLVFDEALPGAALPASADARDEWVRTTVGGFEGVTPTVGRMLRVHDIVGGAVGNLLNEIGGQC